MVKPKDDAKRESYSVRIKPDLLLLVKHLAVDERKTVSELIEEGIELVMEARKKERKG